jgi:hypothetical protein
MKIWHLQNKSRDQNREKETVFLCFVDISCILIITLYATLISSNRNVQKCSFHTVYRGHSLSHIHYVGTAQIVPDVSFRLVK